MTRRRVADDKYGRLWRRAGELVRRVDEGTLPFDRVMTGLRELIEGQFRPVLLQPMLDRGWKIVRDVDEEPLPVSRLKLVPVLQEDESSISGIEAVRRAEELGANFGQAQAQFLLDHQKEIPGTWTERSYRLLFPGTAVRDPEGYVRIVALRQNVGVGGRWWSTDFPWIKAEPDVFDRFVLLRN